ncbi:MAG: cell wall hydrolase [Bacilli bacterium]
MVIKYTNNEVDIMARLMRAEALGEGSLGMLMVGNVIVNRAIATCYTFRNIRTITDVVYQSPGGFSGTSSLLFQARATEKEKELAMRNIQGHTFYPATNALWFYAPDIGQSCRPNWFAQNNSGKYLNHCFYKPSVGICPELY